MLFDTHCHFDSLDDVHNQIVHAYEVGVRAINVIGCDVETTTRSIEAVRLINEQRDSWGTPDIDARATMGLHPHEASHLAEQRDALETLLHDNADVMCGIGETGYDLYYNHSGEQAQTESFLWQLELAKSTGLAMVVHTRDAWDKTFALLNDRGWPSTTVLHCFTGGPSEALACVENGAFISISGIATFKNAADIREAIAVVPLSHLMCETDSPYLAPVPHRGKPNEPAFVSFVFDQVVSIREGLGENREEVRAALYENSLRVFR